MKAQIGLTYVQLFMFCRPPRMTFSVYISALLVTGPEHSQMHVMQMNKSLLVPINYRGRGFCQLCQHEYVSLFIFFFYDHFQPCNTIFFSFFFLFILKYIEVHFFYECIYENENTPYINILQTANAIHMQILDSQYTDAYNELTSNPDNIYCS